MYDKYKTFSDIKFNKWRD